MSLHVICSECGEDFAYFTGSKDERYRFDENIDKIYGVSKIEGNMGSTFSDAKTIDTVYLCEKCFKEKLPNAYKTQKGLVEKNENARLLLKKLNEEEI